VRLPNFHESDDDDFRQSDDDDFRQGTAGETREIFLVCAPPLPEDIVIFERSTVSGLPVEDAVRLVHVDEGEGGQGFAGVEDPRPELPQLAQRQRTRVDAHRPADHILLRKIVPTPDFDDEFPDVSRWLDEFFVKIHDVASAVVEVLDGGLADREGVDDSTALPVTHLRNVDQLRVVIRQVDALLEQTHSLALPVGGAANTTSTAGAVSLMPKVEASDETDGDDTT